MTLSLDPINALDSWARSHAPGHERPDILHSAHASLWKSRPNASSVRASSELQFDWSYSTTFAGTVSVDGQHLSPSAWEKRSHSSLDLGYLSDTSVPILFYDSVILYEDDLHDVGDVRLSVRLRVMPGCFFVLQRLVLRIDQVMIRIRDVRYFHKFGTDEVHRDICWREVEWKNLESLNLPTEVGAWADEAKTMRLVGSIPKVGLPGDLPEISALKLSEGQQLLL
mmetsp:Transcript_37299/g.87012  ORF Transcript_37299/g.87012 Transcript_37299/m.87012 type:complete len:225 (-) Transcript_37299:343-1017(-)